MRLLVTRAADDAHRLEADLRALGHEAISAPLLTIQFEPLPPLTDEAAIIVTSKNGLRAIQYSGWLDAARALPLYCPGPGTAEFARALGFAVVVEGAGDAASLPAILTAHAAQLGARPLAYFCADETAFDLETAAAALGFRMRKQIAYRAHPARTLPETADAALRSNALDGVILMSPRIATIYCDLVTHAGLQPQASSVAAYCLSENVAAKASWLGSRIHIAAAPNTAALLALL